MTGSMTETQLKRLVATAGKTFLGLNMRVIIERGAHLSATARISLTEELYENQAGWKDKDMEGARTRVNAAVRLINEGETERVMEMVLAGDYRVSGEAKQSAGDTLEALKNGALRV